MRIATFNLESLDRRTDAGVRLEERIAILRPQLERLAADILCLQEVNGQHVPGAPHRTLAALDALLADTPYEGFHRTASSGPNGEGVADKHNLVTLSRWPITSRREVRNALLPPLSYAMTTAVPAGTEPVAVAFDRPILHATIALPDGEELSLVNLHLRAPLAAPIPGQKSAPFVWRTVSGWAEGYFLSGLKRSHQALEARLLVDALLDEDPGRLLAVAGDFNASDHETPLRILVGAEEDTGNGLLGARALAVLDRGLPEDRRYSVLHHGRPEMLDHILVSRTLLARFRSVEVHNETLADEAVGYGKTAMSTASYHAPVVAEFVG